MTDTILKIVNIIAGLLKNNIDNLNIPTVLKSASRKLKSLFIQTKDTKEVKPGEPEPENAENLVQTEKLGETSEDGTKEQ